MTQASPAAEIARAPEVWERLAKSWLLEVIDRSPLGELDQVPIGWIATEAAPLIAEVLGQLSDPGAARDLELSPAAAQRISSLAADRGPAGAALLPRELAALQSLLIDALERELHHQDRREFSRAVARLAEVFGAVQAAALGALASPSGQALSNAQANGRSEPSGPIEELRALLVELVREEQQTGAPFALAHVEVEGIERISKGYGEPAATKMGEAVARILEGELSDGERAFWIGPGSFVAVSPGNEAQKAAELALRIREVVESSQGERGPRIGVAVGVASCPAHGRDANGLLESAEEAAWAASASGQQIAFAPVPAMQDR